jgi:Mn2+/Fe2+ NRAMP family transporter
MKFGILLLISSISFGILDALFEVYFEKEFEDKIIYHTKDHILANIITSSISSAISILIYSQIEEYIAHKHKKIPAYDSVGVIVGAFIVYFIYKYLLK